MKIVFFIHHGFSEHSGISKKIQYQIKGLRELGHEVDVCTYIIDSNKHRIRKVNEEIINDYGTGKWASFKKNISYNAVYHYLIGHQIEFVYMRSFHNANPALIHLFRKIKQANIKTVMEIPTYPYDSEYSGFPLQTRIGILVDKLFRNRLAQQMDAIVTFTNYSKIFGKRTICISNGIDFDNTPLRKPKHRENNEIHFIGVAEVHYWHGYDRMIQSIGKYYQRQHEKKIYFHIVGGIARSEMYNSQHAPGFHELTTKYNIEQYILYHGIKFGKELDVLFDMADFAIGSLGRHRSHIDHIKTLKNREYAARGIPFIYSETDDDFDHMPYVIKAPADDSDIDIVNILSKLLEKAYSPIEIRQSICHLSWKEQMSKVLDYQ